MSNSVLSLFLSFISSSLTLFIMTCENPPLRVRPSSWVLGPGPDPDPDTGPGSFWVLVLSWLAFFRVHLPPSTSYLFLPPAALIAPANLGTCFYCFPSLKKEIMAI